MADPMDLSSFSSLEEQVMMGLTALHLLETLFLPPTTTKRVSVSFQQGTGYIFTVVFPGQLTTNINQIGFFVEPWIVQ